MPTGQFHTCGWTDPLATPQIYFRIPMGEFGEPDRNKLFCDLAPWLAVQRAAEREWKVRMNQIGQRQYKSAYDPKTAKDDDLLMSLAGPEPWPPTAAIARALKGDKAMLGLTPLSKEDRKLLGRETEEDLGFAAAPTLAEENPALPPVQKTRVKRAVTYPKFVKKMKAEGITDPAEIKAHWDIYKAEAKV